MKIRPCLLLVFLAAAVRGAEEPTKSAAKFGAELERIVKEGRAGAMKGLIQEMAGQGDAKVVVLIPIAGVAIPSHANYRAAVEAIGGLGDGEAVDALLSLLKKPKLDYRQKVLVLEGFALRKDAPSLGAISAAFKEKTAPVTIAAIRAAEARRERAPIGPLIDLLASRWKARDRVWLEARTALVGLTGHDFESVEDWRKFWDGAPASFDPKTLSEEKGPTGIRLKTVKNAEDAVQFFGTEIFSHNLIFVIDVSGSMFMYDEGGEYKGTNVEQDRQRLRRAKEQLTQALKALRRATLFNIITYSDKVTAWQPKLEPATPVNIGSALKFVNNFEARGPTHTDDALGKAFEDPRVDTIVLLSDGAPARQGAESATLIPKILEQIKDLNAARKITINTFGFEGRGTWPKKVPFAPDSSRLPPPPSDEDVKKFVGFLKDLAAGSGGQFEPIK